MNKSVVKAISVGLLSTILLAGCSNSNQANNSTAQGQKIKIEYWHVNAETQGGKTVEQLVNEFNAQSKDVEVVARYNPICTKV